MTQPEYEARMTTLRNLLTAGGYSIGDCIEALGVSTESNSLGQKAHETWASDDVELGEFTVLSPGADPGYWALAWVWVPHSDVETVAETEEASRG
jgi:hypothetical protein